MAAQEGLIMLPRDTSPDIKLIPATSLDVERLSGSLNAMTCSDTSSGPVPVLSADAVNNLTIVPMTKLDSASLAVAAAAAAAEKQPINFGSPQQQHQLEALRNRRRLLFTQAPPECTEEVIKAWLSQFGAVEQLQMYADGASMLGSNCGLITMASSESAAAVVAAVLGNMQLPEAFQKLSVSWVVQSDDQGMVSSDGHLMPTSLAANADRTIFFAKVPPTALASEVENLFGSFGKLAEVNLFRAWAGARHSKGCGLITYKDRGSAGAAIQQLHGEYIFPGSDCPMVVEWMDLKKQRPAAILPPVDKPPMGCACDTFKLLLNNIPVGVTESALVGALSQFGPVAQLGLTPDPAGPCASGYLWFATKQAADALLNRSKVEPIWLRDPRSGHDLALTVKKTRRPGYNNSFSTTTSRISVGMGALHQGGPLSSTSNSGSNFLPVLQCQLAGLQAAAAQHSQELHSSSARLAAAAAGMGSGSLDTLSMLQNANVMRLLPMPAGAPALLGPSAAMMLQGNGGSTYMAHDVCEAMLDFCDNAGLNMGMPVHLQPTIAAQMATRLNSTMPGLQHPMANSQVCCLPSNMVGNNSGQHCMSSPANIRGLDEFEGSFNMPSLRNNSSNMLGNARLGPVMPSGMPAQQQIMAQQLQQQQQQLQQQQQQQQQQQLQQQLQQPLPAAGGLKSVVVPINPFEVQLIAEHLSFFANQSGAQVTITSLPTTGLAVMMSGQHEQVALAQSLLASARGQC